MINCDVIDNKFKQWTEGMQESTRKYLAGKQAKAELSGQFNSELLDLEKKYAEELAALRRKHEKLIASRRDEILKATQPEMPLDDWHVSKAELEQAQRELLNKCY